jgi:hypothetical protein
MRNVLTLAAAAALAFTASIASADIVAVRDANGNVRLVNTEGGADVTVLEAAGGNAPAECAEGAYYTVQDTANNRTVYVECTSGSRFVQTEEPAVAPGAPENSFALGPEEEAVPSPNKD